MEQFLQQFDPPKRRFSREMNGTMLMLTVVIALSLVMFVIHGSSVLAMAVGVMTGRGEPADSAHVATVILNIALILFSWRRHADLRDQMAERAAAEQRARRIAYVDPLTEFGNRRAMMEIGARVLDDARTHGRTVAVMLLDLDFFKHVNDLHGHAVGDQMIVTVARAVREVLPADALLARLGGDEFAMIFPIRDRDDPIVAETAQRMVSRLALPFNVEGRSISISASLGLTVGGQDHETVNGLTKQADIAMYNAKQQGRNRYAWFDEPMRMMLQERTRLEAEFSAAVSAREIEPYFDPIADMVTGRLAALEALPRWVRRDGSVLAPDHFMPIADGLGLSSEMTLNMLSAALEEARAWHPSLVVCCRLNARMLSDAWLPQKIIKIMTQLQMPATRLQLSISETALFDNITASRAVVISLRNQGFGLVLEGFGKGHSALAHLRELPFDRIKIDQSFVANLMEPETAAIVTAICRLGQTLGRPVGADGVDTLEIGRRLRELGIDRGQGRYFGVPMSVAATRDVLASAGLLVVTTPDSPSETPPPLLYSNGGLA